MCYSGSCPYETYDGGCHKPRNKPCPQDEEDVAAYEDAMDMKYEQKLDDLLREKLEAE